MSCCNISIERMQQDLLNGGWRKVRFDLWETPWGVMYRGPHKAWHIWAGTPMERDGAKICPRCGGSGQHKMDCRADFNLTPKEK